VLVFSFHFGFSATPRSFDEGWEPVTGTQKEEKRLRCASIGGEDIVEVPRNHHIAKGIAPQNHEGVNHWSDFIFVLSSKLPSFVAEKVIPFKISARCPYHRFRVQVVAGGPDDVSIQLCKMETREELKHMSQIDCEGRHGKVVEDLVDEDALTQPSHSYH